MYWSYLDKANISDWISPCESSSPSKGCHVSQYGLFVFQGSFQQLPHSIVQHPSSNQIGIALCRGISSSLSNSSLSYHMPESYISDGPQWCAQWRIQRLWHFNSPLCASELVHRATGTVAAVTHNLWSGPEDG